MRSSDLVHDLYKIANSQHGYYSNVQAGEIGYQHKNFNYHLNENHWTRVLRGVYRLNDYPPSQFEEYFKYSLWVGQKQGRPIGVYSYLTALSFYGLSESASPQIHITIPKKHRIRKKIPENVVFHKENLYEKDVRMHSGFYMTTVHKTLLDLAKSNLIDPEQLARSVVNTYNKGLIDRYFLVRNLEFRAIDDFIKESVFL